METTAQARTAGSAYWALRIAFGVIPVAAGADKFTNLLTDWQAYLSPLAKAVLPISPAAFMAVAGVVEIAVGLAILTGHARIFGYVAAGWLLAIAVNLLTTGAFFDVAARDVGLALSAFALAKLAPAVELAGERRVVRQAREAQAHAHA